MFRFEKKEMTKPIYKTEEEPGASRTYSDKLVDNLTVVNVEEKVTVDKFDNHLTVKEYPRDSNVDTNLNEEEQKLQVRKGPEDNKVRKLIRQFETREKKPEEISMYTH